jgi:hypothetical protein
MLAVSVLDTDAASLEVRESRLAVRSVTGRYQANFGRLDSLPLRARGGESTPQTVAGQFLAPRQAFHMPVTALTTTCLVKCLSTTKRNWQNVRQVMEYDSSSLHGGCCVVLLL